MGLGQVRVLIRIDDPWAPIAPPVMLGDDPANVFEIVLGEIDDCPSNVESQFARWLAGVGQRPNLPGAAELAARLYGKIEEIDSELDSADLRSGLAAIVGAETRSLATALKDSPLTLSQLMELIVESGVAAAPITDSKIRITGLWSQSVFLGVLCEGNALGNVDQEIYLSELQRFAGDSAIQLLETGRDEYASIGRFGPEAEVMDAKSLEQLGEIWAAAAPIPGRALDADSRLLRARDLFDSRHAEALVELLAGSRSWLDRVRDVLRSDLGLGGLGPINSRSGNGGWLDLPAISIGFALVARLAARKVPLAQRLFDAARANYAKLAAEAPGMVEQDLIIAELWLTSRRNEWKR